MRPVHFARLALQRASADPTTCCCWQAGEKERERGAARESQRVLCSETTAWGLFAEEIMQFAIWLVALMCHLSAFVQGTLQYRLHPKQGSVLFWCMSLKVFSQLSVVFECDAWYFYFYFLQKASSSSCHHTKSSPRSVWMTSENRFHMNCTTEGDGEV